MLILIKNGTLYNPNFEGKKDILLAGNKIIKIDDQINISGIEFEEIDATDKIIIPGLIDNHVHICGGGGEGGFKTRTPEIRLSQIIKAGITTIVGLIGTDGTTRTMTNLLAKAYGLQEEGITTFVYTGSYQVPVRTLTGHITDDIMLIEKIIGTGEISLSDHRSSFPSIEEFRRLSADSRVGGILSGKAGIINVHMGDSENPLELLERIIEETDIPKTQFLPTHMNRNQRILKDTIKYAKNGGYVDFTTSTTPEFVARGETIASKAVRILLNDGVNIKNITISSDGQGSLPVFNKLGILEGLKVGDVSSVLECIRQMIQTEKIDMEKAFMTATSNPADILKLKDKGYIKENYDADITILTNKLEVDTVIARGSIMMRNKELLVIGTFE